MTTRSLPLLLLPLVALGGLAACGGDDGPAKTAEEGSEFCELAADAEALGDEVDFNVTDPEALEETTRAAQEAAEETLQEAPEDIQEVLEQNVEFQATVVDLLEEFDWDPVAAYSDDEGRALLEDEEAQERLEEVRDYLEDKCGIENDADDDPVDTGDPMTSDPMTSDAGTGDGGAIDLPEGDEGFRRFIQLYSIGSGVEVTDEQEACLVDELSSSVTVEQLEVVMGDVEDEDVQIAVGLAFISCGVIEG